MQIEYHYHGIPVIVSKHLERGKIIKIKSSFVYPRGALMVGEDTDLNDFVFIMNTDSDFDRSFLAALHIAR